MKHFPIIVFLIFGTCFCGKAQSLRSPNEFLGYEIGSRFTPHYRLVQYFEYMAKAAPERMKLEVYGYTNEGRPLMIAIITSPANFPRLEETRKNNLRLAGFLKDAPATTAAPAIAWMSYNVHGNEASSSEVAMQALHELLDPANLSVQGWLNNTVVIIDPCLNPDGRDRYVNWYNQVVGNSPNPNPEAKEHSEPWPEGRGNHYLFDLNRDWAWQTQAESQQRMKKYHEWMPQVHADFHEQYAEGSYFFAPAAEPFHDAITPWQRSFQNTIGRRHATYFDERGWLYFTKEYFDLFYPSYGDTYPLFNGGIGMTYEQPGHGRAGLAIALPGGDTLTLKDRVQHHLITTRSTLETVSANAVSLVANFKQYFDDAAAGKMDEYKTYILNNAGKIPALKDFFIKNKIQFGLAPKGRQVKAYNYFTGRNESYTTREGDLLIPAAQPKSVLVRVLFEPNSRLSDSATYDITAWALPYVYGLQAYASKDPLPMQPLPSSGELPAQIPNGYGYLVNYRSMEEGKLLAALVKNNIRVRVAEKPFEFNGTSFTRGSLIILRSGNEQKLDKFFGLVKELNIIITPVSSGFMESGFDFGSDKVKLLKKPLVGLVMGKDVSSTAAGTVWHFFEQQLNYPVTLINSEDLGQVELKNYSVLVMPDGSYNILQTKEAAADLRSWIRNGGRLIAMENAVSQLAGLEWGLKLKKPAEEKPEERKENYNDLRKYDERDREPLVNAISGAIYKLELDNSHPLGFGYPLFYHTLKMNDNLYEFSRENWNVGVIKKENQVSGFVGSKVREKIKDGTVIGVLPMGRGSVVYFADSPLFRNFWENGKLLFTNAVFLVGQ